MSNYFPSIKTFTCFVLMSVSSKLLAWQPCAALCDAACIGNSMAQQSLQYSAKFAELIPALAKVQLGLEKATSNYSEKLGKAVVDAWTAVGDDIETVSLVTAPPLGRSFSLDQVTAFNNLAIKYDAAAIELDGSRKNTYLSVINSLKAAGKSAITLSNRYDDSVNTLKDSSVDNLGVQAYRMNAPLIYKTVVWNDRIPKIAAYIESFEGANGLTGVIADKTSQQRNLMAESLLFDDDLEDPSIASVLLSDTPFQLSASIASSEAIRNRNFENFTDYDFQSMKMSNTIDLYSLWLIKSMNRSISSHQLVRNYYLSQGE